MIYVIYGPRGLALCVLYALLIGLYGADTALSVGPLPSKDLLLFAGAHAPIVLILAIFLYRAMSGKPSVAGIANGLWVFGTLAAYFLSFAILFFPEHSQRTRPAREALRKYNSVVKSRNVQNLLQFCAQNPGSPHAQAARALALDLAYSNALESGSGMDWALLVKEFPEQPRYDEARTRAQTLLISQGTNRRDSAFLRTYLDIFPAGSNVTLATALIDQFDYEAITNRLSQVAGGQPPLSSFASSLVMTLASHLHQTRDRTVMFSFSVQHPRPDVLAKFAKKGVPVNKMPKIESMVNVAQLDRQCLEAIQEFVDTHCGKGVFRFVSTDKLRQSGDQTVSNVVSRASAAMAPSFDIVCSVYPSGATYREQQGKNDYIGLRLYYWFTFTYKDLAAEDAGQFTPPDNIMQSIPIRPRGALSVADFRPELAAQQTFYSQQLANLFAQLQAALKEMRQPKQER